MESKPFEKHVRQYANALVFRKTQPTWKRLHNNSTKTLS